jgi:hypothetical protein
MAESPTTKINFINRNGQRVVRTAQLPGSDYNQRVYVLSCGHCGNEYGANGSDVWHRLCPFCQEGEAGLPTG